ncbi:hypothetical protein QAO71_16815 [Halopseudomonas sp. SMJS2]|uniref:hypothetical protein n=1 Tax=Halopseudomonas sp. SMJS2 TaxID=3041098 RepID=UPI00245317E6|nr:hypothetical protein [Halopseudomonas sp. SMJS2]WGK61683.1 hypothetical protein QAO71_16815 [Halopseudomonas sp. SMJS2]
MMDIHSPIYPRRSDGLANRLVQQLSTRLTRREWRRSITGQKDPEGILEAFMLENGHAWLPSMCVDN